MVSLLRISPTFNTIECCNVRVTFKNGEIRDYPHKILNELKLERFPNPLNASPDLFELLIEMRKKCLNEVAGEWVFENPYLFEDVRDLIVELYGLSTNHPFQHLEKELSSLTIEQADTVMRSFHPSKDVIMTQGDTVARFASRPNPLLVQTALKVINNKNLGADFYIKKTNLTLALVQAEKRHSRKKNKLSKELPDLQRKRIECEIDKLDKRIKRLSEELLSLSDPQKKDDLSSRMERDATTLPISICFNGQISVKYPPGLRRYLYSCQFYSKDRPTESITVFEKKEIFDIYIGLIEGKPLRKQLGSRLCDEIYLFEKLSNLFRIFTKNCYEQIREQLSYLTLEEAKRVAGDNKRSHLKEIGAKILVWTSYFTNEDEASKFFKERAETYDECHRIKKKLAKNPSRDLECRANELKDQLDLMERKLKALPLSIEGLLNLAKNKPSEQAKALEKVKAYRENALSLLKVPDHLKPYVDLFDRYGYFVRKIEGKTVISFCGTGDFEFDFEYAGPYEFETALRNGIDHLFPAAGDPIYQSAFEPTTEEEQILSYTPLYRHLPRLITEQTITVPVSDKVNEARGAFISGQRNQEHTRTLIEVNEWEQFGISPEHLEFSDVPLTCTINKNGTVMTLNIHPITLRATFKNQNRPRTLKFIGEKLTYVAKADV